MAVILRLDCKRNKLWQVGLSTSIGSFPVSLYPAELSLAKALSTSPSAIGLQAWDGGSEMSTSSSKWVWHETLWLFRWAWIHILSWNFLPHRWQWGTTDKDLLPARSIPWQTDSTSKITILVTYINVNNLRNRCHILQRLGNSCKAKIYGVMYTTVMLGAFTTSIIWIKGGLNTLWNALEIFKVISE